MSKEVKLNSVVAGESVLELAKLREIRRLAETEIEKNEAIIKSHKDVEFKTETTFELNSQQIDELNQDGYYDNKIEQIVVRKSGKQCILFIGREKD